MELEQKKFKTINLSDSFFDSLKAAYSEFTDWFVSKSEQSAYVFENEEGIQGFLYLKTEDGIIDDVTPPLPPKTRIKVGTMKINAHGTKMGERFVKKILDHAVHSSAAEIYVTVFEEHQGLIRLLNRYGFNSIGHKHTKNGTEQVMLKSLELPFDNFYLSYPKVNLRNANCYVLSLWPMWHTRLLPDSMLRNERSDIVEDVSSANSIHKVYLCAMKGVEVLKPGDVIVIYRTSDDQGPAHYRSVATSIGVIEDYKNIHEFSTKEEFFRYCRAHSVFNHAELEMFWKSKKYFHVFKFTYNIAFKRRVNRATLIEELGLSSPYWGFFKISDKQLQSIAAKGEVNEGLIVN
ncbi:MULTISPECIES: N-acetyltransferase [unclassified Pseudomonas]|uniref:N-acetyltransferase n=1 Tax=unclassified Pseudomonas TaxID=196821 RepID=UPI000D3B8908|nr:MULTISPECIES: N-acetyltransferase [unclassified Pseudomonas]RAU48781.1 N-acetyltransferase [Pseudomonas sp. RIT 409]RAU53959.1 N-acetyltransferase [Pseudomonas sp. RIT 412]